MSAPEPDRWRLKAHNADECNYERCSYCGCCAHGAVQRGGCPVDSAPVGMRCPGPNECGCEGGLS